MSVKQQARYMHELGPDGGPMRTTRAIMPSIIALLAVSIPNRVACYTMIGLPFCQENFNGLARLFSGFLRSTMENEKVYLDPLHNSLFIPSIEDQKENLHEIRRQLSLLLRCATKCE